jgi:hypothetical protein
MADLTVFPIPQAPINYNRIGKKVMIHDLTQPEATSTKLLDFESINSIPLTYTELTNLISTNSLLQGSMYLLIDFQTIYDQMDFDAGGSLKPTLVTKTGATEQIWVLALAPNQIASKAYSATYPNDQIQYDWTYNTTFVNGSPAKGRISERIDENNNRTDYDHREIKFIRYDDGAGNFTVINDNGNASQEFLTFVQNFTGGIVYNNYLGDFYAINSESPTGQEFSNNIFFGDFILNNTSSSLFFNNTFKSNETYGNEFSGTIYNIIVNLTGEFHGNIFSGEHENISFNDNTAQENIFSGSMGGVIFNDGLNDNILSGSIRNSTFFSIQGSILSGSIYNSLFSENIGGCIFTGNIQSSTFTHTNPLQYCTIASTLSNKTIDETTYPILFGNGFKKEILKGSDNNDYIKTFDGTIDQYILIP